LTGFKCFFNKHPQYSLVNGYTYIQSITTPPKKAEDVKHFKVAGIYQTEGTSGLSMQGCYIAFKSNDNNLNLYGIVSAGETGPTFR
jgi:hypothetical protein